MTQRANLLQFFNCQNSFDPFLATLDFPISFLLITHLEYRGLCKLHIFLQIGFNLYDVMSLLKKLTTFINVRRPF